VTVTTPGVSVNQLPFVLPTGWPLVPGAVPTEPPPAELPPPPPPQPATSAAASIPAIADFPKTMLSTCHFIIKNKKQNYKGEVFLKITFIFY
jgi:hypothetical protein